MSIIQNYIQKLSMHICQTIILMYIHNTTKYMIKSNYNIEYTMLNLQKLFTFFLPSNTKQYLNRHNKDECNRIAKQNKF